MSEDYLKSFFDPTSIALIGASTRENTLGKLLYDHLSADFTGELHLVNPHHKVIGELVCHAKIKDLPEGIDLAIVVTPFKTLIKIIRQCGKKNIKNVLLMTNIAAKDTPSKKAELNKILMAAREAGVRVLGPGAASLIRTSSSLNAGFNDNKVYAGKLALVTRSRSICNAVLDWADNQQIGFSSVVCFGRELDLSLSDILEFLVNDHHTRSIIIQLDDIIDSRSFMSAVKAAAIRKPVVILKSSHDSGSYSNSIVKIGEVRSMDDVFHAAVSRAGVDRVYTLSNLYAAAKVLSSNQRTQGTRLGIISNGRGPIMLANDSMRHLGIAVSRISKDLQDKLEKNVNFSCVNENAVLVAGGQSTAESFSLAASIMLESDEIDAIAVMYSPDPFASATEAAEILFEAVKATRKPIFAVWLGGASIVESRRILTDQKILNYRTPEAAIEAFSFLCTHLRNRELLLQTPYPLSKTIPPELEAAKDIIQRNLQQKRNVLSQVDSRLLLEAFHIPCTPSLQASTVEQALEIADQFGYPIALKIDSSNIAYKSDVDGVILDISSPASLKKAYKQMMRSAADLLPTAIIDGVVIEPMYAPNNGRELMIRIINDPTFGPVISFGAGGKRSPALSDRAIQLPPLNRRLAENLIDNTLVSQLLGQFRNMPAANKEKLREVLIRVSEIACELPQVFELTINPLVLNEHQAMVNNAKVVVRNYDPDKKKYAHLAIHPYPSDWRRSITIKNNINVEIRPIRGEDAYAEVEFVKNMSNESKYFRFMHAVNVLTPEMLSRFTKLDYDREMAFAAFVNLADSQTGQEVDHKVAQEKILGISRYAINPDKNSCEFAIVVADDWQGLGLARQLMLILIEHVKNRDLKVIEGTVLRNNSAMDKLMKSLGFKKYPSHDDYDINIYRCEM
jgi:acetyltransferase